MSNTSLRAALSRLVSEMDCGRMPIAADWSAARAALAVPDVIPTQSVKEALWIIAEHNSLKFGENHNTTIIARAVLAALDSHCCRHTKMAHSIAARAKITAATNCWKPATRFTLLSVCLNRR